MCEGLRSGWLICIVFLCVPQVQLFSDPGFQGTVLALEDSVASLQDGFSVASCKVLAGRWVTLPDKISHGGYSELWSKSNGRELKHHPAKADFRNRLFWIPQRWSETIAAAYCSCYKSISGTQDLLQAVTAPLTKKCPIWQQLVIYCTYFLYCSIHINYLVLCFGVNTACCLSSSMNTPCDSL